MVKSLTLPGVNLMSYQFREHQAITTQIQYALLINTCTLCHLKENGRCYSTEINLYGLRHFYTP